MASKRLYLQIIQHYGQFTLPTKDRISHIHFNEAVTIVNAKIANKYNVTIVTMAHLAMTLGIQMLNDLAEEFGEEAIKKVLSGEVKISD